MLRQGMVVARHAKFCYFYRELPTLASKKEEHRRAQRTAKFRNNSIVHTLAILPYYVDVDHLVSYQMLKA